MKPDNPPSSYGTNGASQPVFEVVSSNIAIVFEWAALLPLAIYLANSRLPHELVGQTALSGFICIGLFPRLGILDGISEFVARGPDFLDRASSVSELRRTVWDIRWGSVFPCANGAVSDILTAHALRDAGEPKLMPEQRDPSDNNASFRRYQTLHILKCSRSSDSSTHDMNAHDKFNIRRLGSSGLPLAFEFVLLLTLLGACVITVLFGLYGTAVSILICIVFRFSRQLITIERPSGYLKDNEKKDDCGGMLVALHENASTWVLYHGSRAVIDTLLNKTMIQSIGSPIVSNAVLAGFLRLIGILQLVTMTYVASQKGWDGVALLVLVIVAWSFDHMVYRKDRVAALWLRRENVTITAQSFKFSGRKSMIGAIQIACGSKVVSWMDGILVPSHRRDVWLSELGLLATEQEQVLERDDRARVDRSKVLTISAADIIRLFLKPPTECSPASRTGGHQETSDRVATERV